MINAPGVTHLAPAPTDELTRLHADRRALQPRSTRRHAEIELAQKVLAPQLYARGRPGFSTRKRIVDRYGLCSGLLVMR